MKTLLLFMLPVVLLAACNNQPKAATAEPEPIDGPYDEADWLGEATVIADKAHFFEDANLETQLDEGCIEGTLVEVTKIEQQFGWISYASPEGKPIEGWVLLDDLQAGAMLPDQLCQQMTGYYDFYSPDEEMEGVEAEIGLTIKPDRKVQATWTSSTGIEGTMWSEYKGRVYNSSLIEITHEMHCHTEPETEEGYICGDEQEVLFLTMKLEGDVLTFGDIVFKRSPTP